MKQRILIVEDEPMLVRALSQFMKRKGHQPVSCTNSADMRQQMLQNTFDVVICDMNIPGGKGVDLIREVIQVHKEITCVLVSADFPDTACDAITVQNLNVHYRQKPYDLYDLLQLVESSSEQTQNSVEKQ